MDIFSDEALCNARKELKELAIEDLNMYETQDVGLIRPGKGSSQYEGIAPHAGRPCRQGRPNAGGG